MDNMQEQELISALADGQLEGDLFARAVVAASDDEAGRNSWAAYHLIGEVLRAGDRASCAAPRLGLERLRAQLQGEARVAAPVVVTPHARASAASANDPSFRWKIVAGVASAASVVLIGWNVAGGIGSKPEAAQVAAAAGPAAPVQPVVMLRDPRLDEFLAAHRQYGGASALQTPTGFLRNATFEGPAR